MFGERRGPKDNLSLLRRDGFFGFLFAWGLICQENCTPFYSAFYTDVWSYRTYFWLFLLLQTSRFPGTAIFPLPCFLPTWVKLQKQSNCRSIMLCKVNGTGAVMLGRRRKGDMGNNSSQTERAWMPANRALPSVFCHGLKASPLYDKLFARQISKR